MTRQPRPDDRRNAFDAEALKHLSVVRGVARRLAGSAAEADDLAQETYVRALGHAARFRQGTNLRAWLLTILRNISRNRRRDAAKAIVKIDSDTVAQLAQQTVGGETPEQRLLRGVLDTDLRAALESLPHRLRETLWLCDVEEMAYADIARRLRIPVGTVMSRVFRARRILFARLSGCRALREQDGT
jgi:RNA polymerase sigma-70 factor (ECF subfamily)